MPIVFKIRLLTSPKYLRKAFRVASTRPVSIQNVQRVVEEVCDEKPLSLFSTFNKIYRSARGSRSREFSCNNLILSIVRELNKTNRILAIQFAEKYQPLAEDERFVKTLAELYLRNGKPVLALNVLSKLPDSKRDQNVPWRKACE